MTSTMAAGDDFEMTQDEMRRISDAMKDKKFVELLLEYTKEISDPENKKKYEEEIIAMEKERGNNVRVLSPQSGFVVKTMRLTDGMKVFMNICSSPQIQDCSFTPEMRNGKKGSHVSLPHSLSPVREDIDKAGKPCVVYDICFHPNTYAKSVEDIKFRQLLIDTAFDTLEKKSNAKVDRKKKSLPKMKYKGTPQTNIIRPVGTKTESNSMPIDDLTNETLNNIKDNNPITHIDGKVKDDNVEVLNSSLPAVTTASSKDKNVEIPEYKIVQRGYFDMQNFTYAREDLSNIPKELVVEIKLPRAKSAAGIDLDIFEKELVLDSKEPPYHLEMSLPYEVKEADGQAQFDTSENTLVVTLPVVKPKKNAICEIATEPSVVDITHTLDNDDMKNEKSNNLDSDLYTQNQLTDKAVERSETSEETVSSMLFGNFPSNDDNMNGGDDDDMDDDTFLVDIATIREHLQKDLLDASSNVDVKFDTSNFECFRPSSKLPPYCYTQTPEKINVTVTIPDVKVIYLSLGFSEQQAYMSYPRNAEDANSPFWELVIRLDDGCYLDNENCGVDVTDSHLELILRKHPDSFRLWEKFFVGLSEASLEVEFFTTDDIAEDMLKSISESKACVVEVDTSTKEEDIQMEKKSAGLESRLSQLLQNQEEFNCKDAVEEVDEPSPKLNQKNSMNFKESNGVAEDDDDDNAEDKDCGESKIASKLHQTNIDETNELSIPEESKMNGSVNPTTDDESPTSHRQFYGRSLSLGNDSSYEGEAVLHSILKYSKSDGEYYCEEEEDDDLSCSANSFPDSIFDDHAASEPTFGRRRVKSVTFNDEPTIFEFAKLSKRQIKKQMKEERLRQATQHKSVLSGTFSKFSQSPPTTVANGIEIEQKGKSKKKDKCEKKNRSYSDGLLQVPNSILSRHKMQKKKKKNKKHDDEGNEDSPSNSISDNSPEPNTDETPVLNNPLIFELE